MTATTDPDTADDLFGWPPRPPVKCPSCGIRAEPWKGLMCWLCWQTGTAARLLDSVGVAARRRLMGSTDDAADQVFDRR